MHLNDHLGLRQTFLELGHPARQAFVLLRQRCVGVRLAASFLRRQRVQLTALALATPGAQVRGVQALAAKHLAHATRLEQRISLAQNPKFVRSGEAPTLRLRRDLRIR